jgi:L-lactate dehydrogenase complex protein LldG
MNLASRIYPAQFPSPEISSPAHTDLKAFPMDHREETLNRIRQSLQTGVLPAASFDHAPTTEATEIDRSALIASFVREAQTSGAEIFQPTTFAEVAETLIDLLKQTGQQAITWADEDLPIKDMREILLRAGVTRHVPDLVRDPALRRQTWQNLDGIRVGITGALAGIADTGSIVVQSGPQRSRAASLLPEMHIALLSIDRLYPTMSTFFAAHDARNLTVNSSNLVFITGPSRTADIEMIITRGVHGPKRLCVVLLP